MYASVRYCVGIELYTEIKKLRIKRSQQSYNLVEKGLG